MFNHHFNKTVIKKLMKKNIVIIGLQAIPNMDSEMPWANAETGYILDDNGCSKVRTRAQVIEMANE